MLKIASLIGLLFITTPVLADGVVVGGSSGSNEKFIVKDKDGHELLRIERGGCIAVKPATCSREVDNNTITITPGWGQFNYIPLDVTPK